MLTLAVVDVPLRSSSVRKLLDVRAYELVKKRRGGQWLYSWKEYYPNVSNEMNFTIHTIADYVSLHEEMDLPKVLRPLDTMKSPSARFIVSNADEKIDRGRYLFARWRDWEAEVLFSEGNTLLYNEAKVNRKHHSSPL